MDFVGIGIKLGKDCGNSIVQCTCFYDSFVLQLKVSKDQSRGKGGLQQLESTFTVGSPDKCNVLLCCRNEGFGDSRVFKDELPIEVSKTKEGLDVFNRLWSWPGLDNVSLGFLHSDSRMGDNISEERGGSFVEFTFLGFSKEMTIPEVF